MSYAEVWTPPDCGPNSYAGTAHYIYLCKPCRSQQDVDISTGKIYYHTFKVGKYQLSFHPESDWWPFSISDCSDEVNGPEQILSLKVLPTEYTPQNTTEERIRTLLVFS
jgi:hypothetical protein